MNEAQEKRQFLKAFNELNKRTRERLVMASSLYHINGIECALEFIAKMKEYDQAEQAGSEVAQ